MTLAADEFLRRFFLHVLPKGFVRIRHFGFLANRFRTARLQLCRHLLSCSPPPAIITSNTTTGEPRPTWSVHNAELRWNCSCGSRHRSLSPGTGFSIPHDPGILVPLRTYGVPPARPRIGVSVPTVGAFRSSYDHPIRVLASHLNPQSVELPEICRPHRHPFARSASIQSP